MNFNSMEGLHVNSAFQGGDLNGYSIRALALNFDEMLLELISNEINIT